MYLLKNSLQNNLFEMYIFELRVSQDKKTIKIYIDTLSFYKNVNSLIMSFQQIRKEKKYEYIVIALLGIHKNDHI